MNPSAHFRKYFMLGASVCPPSCCRQASCPSSRPTFTPGILALCSEMPSPFAPSRLNTGLAATAAVKLPCWSSHLASLLRQSVTDESQARRTQGDEFVGVYRQVARILAAEHGVRRPILHEVASHAVVFAAGEVLHRFAKVAAQEGGAALAGGTHKDHGKALVKGHGDKRRLSKA